jgi:hypothetical protein
MGKRKAPRRAKVMMPLFARMLRLLKRHCRQIGLTSLHLGRHQEKLFLDLMAHERCAE